MSIMKLWDENSEEWKAVPTLKGDPGPKGDQGIPGEGLIPGGTTGQVLKKKTNTDFDTEWGEVASVLVKATGAEVITGTDDEKYVTPKAIKDGMLVSGDTLPIGSQIPFTSLTIPDNWLLCDGRAISRIDYSELFSVIGTSYGAGDGTTTFNLPNKKGRTSVGHDSSQTEFNTVGKTGGAKTHTLTVAQMPSHTHSFSAVRTFDYEQPNGTGYYRSAIVNSSGTTGGCSGNAHNNLQPYETDVWIIKAKQSSGVVATVVDTLDSTSPTNALSANMGRELKTEIITNEIKPTNEWVDGKRVYVKRLFVQSFPNNTNVTLASGLASNHRIVNIDGYAFNGASFRKIGSPDTLIVYSDNYSSITIQTTVDRSSFSGYINIYFTYN